MVSLPLDMENCLHVLVNSVRSSYIAILSNSLEGPTDY
jgi:hypothetical protein